MLADASLEEFALAINEYIDYYNNKRIQAKTKYRKKRQK